MKVGIILTPDERSKAYLQKLLSNKIRIDEIIFMNNNVSEKEFSVDLINESKKCGFDISESVKYTLEHNNLQYKEFDFININEPKLIEYLKKSKMDYFIFTGGGILKSNILNVGPKFIHLHPGIVPDYRGSTCFYYSIINQNNCGVTVYIMDEKLDTGDIILQKTFSMPNNPYIDDVYDAHIRSETLIQVLKNNLLEKGNFSKQNEDGNTYFIIHPVLKHIAILNCLK